MDFIKFWFKVLGVMVTGLFVLWAIVIGFQWLSDHHYYGWIVTLIVLVLVTLIALATYEDFG